jgi:hypothetical protein
MDIIRRTLDPVAASMAVTAPILLPHIPKEISLVLRLNGH